MKTEDIFGQKVIRYDIVRELNILSVHESNNISAQVLRNQKTGAMRVEGDIVLAETKVNRYLSFSSNDVHEVSDESVYTVLSHIIDVVNKDIEDKFDLQLYKK